MYTPKFVTYPFSLILFYFYLLLFIYRAYFDCVWAPSILILAQSRPNFLYPYVRTNPSYFFSILISTIHSKSQTLKAFFIFFFSRSAAHSQLLFHFYSSFSFFFHFLSFFTFSFLSLPIFIPTTLPFSLSVAPLPAASLLAVPLPATPLQADSLLQRRHGAALEPQIALEVPGDFMHQPLKKKLPAAPCSSGTS